MKFCILLHFYQPANQQDDILKRVVNECYLPVTRGLLENPRAKLVININGALTKLLLEKGYAEVVENIKKLLERDQIELMGSAMYHAFLPLLSPDEIARQIDANYEISRKYYGEKYVPSGFFSPEMAVNSNVLKIVSQKGYKWLACPEFSYIEGYPDLQTLYKDLDTGLNLLFRNKRVSSLILSAVCRDATDLISETRDIYDKDLYWFCVMDAETFGHHRIGHEKMLISMLNSDKFQPVTAEGLFTDFNSVQKISIRPSTWSNQEQDFWLDKEELSDFNSVEAKSFILWKDPTNPIHKAQWELTNLISETVNKYDNKSNQNYIDARYLLDAALSSDQYWWASAKPWWSLEMIEQGAYALKSVISTLYPSDANNDVMKKAEMLYRAIIDKAFEWQRTGVIRNKHLQDSSTYLKEPLLNRTPTEWFNQLMLEFEAEMNRAAASQNFEKAIKWRDALIKIHLKNDIYDVKHVVDELWAAAQLPTQKPFLTYSWSEFSSFIKQYLFDRHFNTLTEQSFEEWKKEVARK